MICVKLQGGTCWWRVIETSGSCGEAEDAGGEEAEETSGEEGEAEETRAMGIRARSGSCYLESQGFHYWL